MLFKVFQESNRVLQEISGHFDMDTRWMAHVTIKGRQVGPRCEVIEYRVDVDEDEEYHRVSHLVMSFLQSVKIDS